MCFAGAFDEPTTRQFMRQILRAVQFLHDNMLVHRDLKYVPLDLPSFDYVHALASANQSRRSLDKL